MLAKYDIYKIELEENPITISAEISLPGFTLQHTDSPLTGSVEGVVKRWHERSVYGTMSISFRHITVTLSGDRCGTVPPRPSSRNWLLSQPFLILLSFRLMHGRSKIVLPRMTIEGRTSARTKFGGV